MRHIGGVWPLTVRKARLSGRTRRVLTRHGNRRDCRDGEAGEVKRRIPLDTLVSLDEYTRAQLQVGAVAVGDYHGVQLKEYGSPWLNKMAFASQTILDGGRG